MAFEFSPFSRKQLEVIADAQNQSGAFINILEGSVRSGKTISSIVGWIEYVKSSPHRKFLMSGVTVDTLYSNVIEDIENIYGKKRAKFVKSAEGGATLRLTFFINGKKVKKICICRGSENEATEKKIRGNTYGGWYADEITLHHKNFVKTAINRCSLKNARIWWTTNPDTPFHYIKTDYIEKAEKEGYNHWHFTLEDNFSLDPIQVQRIKRAYSGLWYQRMILGLWVLAEGIIYDMFNQDKHVKETIDREYRDYYISCDYGTQNPMAFGLWGRVGKAWYKVKEYHYSGRAKNKQKDDQQYYDDLVEFIGKRRIKSIIVDPSAASFIATIRKHGLYNVIKANNDVDNGIRNLATALNQEMILYNDCCKETFKEFSSYVWDEKAQERGIDEPLKQNDHHMDGDRYFVHTVIFKGRIDPLDISF